MKFVGTGGVLSGGVASEKQRPMRDKAKQVQVFAAAIAALQAAEKELERLERESTKIARG